MFASLRDFLDTWRREAGHTERVLAALTDEALDRRVAPGHRTAGEIAWHLAVSHRSILAPTGLSWPAPRKEDPVPERAAAIRARYAESARGLARAVETQWSEEDVRVTDEIYGMVWPRGRTLLVLLLHEVHHRGQLTVLMRQARLPVPGVYGPSRDER